MHLVTGFANKEHIKSADQGSFNAAMLGEGQFVLERGNKFASTIISNNVVRIKDGDILMQGRHIRLDEGTYIDLDFENGQQGYKRNDLIVVRYTKDESSGVEETNLVVIKGTPTDGEPSDPEITEGDIINDHVLINEMKLYRVPLDGLNIQELVCLFEVLPSWKTLKATAVEETQKAVKEQAEQTLQQETEKLNQEFKGVEGKVDTEIQRLQTQTAQTIEEFNESSGQAVEDALSAFDTKSQKVLDDVTQKGSDAVSAANQAVQDAKTQVSNALSDFDTKSKQALADTTKKGDDAVSAANTAVTNANKAIEDANKAIQAAEDAKETIGSEANKKVDAAIESLNQRADTVLNTVEENSQTAIDKADEALQKAVTLTGTSDPTTSTVGVLGQHYVNTSTNQIFHCVGVNGSEYTWISAAQSVYKKMTAIIDLSNSNPGTCVSYADDAIGMTADQWDSFFGHYPCLFKDGMEVEVLDRNDFSKFSNGRTADITSGNAGDVMIAFPRRGLKISKSGSKVTISMTDDPNNPDFKYYAHQRGDTRKEVFYMGAYKGYHDGSSLRSLSGKVPTANITIGTARNYARANGSGYEQSAFYQLLFRQCAYILKYGSLDSQTAVGRGYVDDQDMYPYTGKTGEANAYGMDCEKIRQTNPNYMTDGKHHVKCFGVEDFWGAIYEWIDGLVTDTSNPRNILTNTDNFQDDGKGKGYMSTPSGISSSASGYMKEPQGNTEAGFVIKAGSGSSSTYFADYAYLYGGYVASAGGSWDDGDYAGAFFLYVSRSASDSYAYVAARLMCL